MGTLADTMGIETLTLATKNIAYHHNYHCLGVRRLPYALVTIGNLKLTLKSCCEALVNGPASGLSRRLSQKRPMIHCAIFTPLTFLPAS